MTTVIDQARPWLMPSSTLAATIQPQLGARAIMGATGKATSQPMTSRRFRPTRSASTPAPRFVNAFATPNATTKARIARSDVRPKSSSPTRGRTLRSRPTIAPTSAFRPTRRLNCAAFARSPSWIAVMRRLVFRPACSRRRSLPGERAAAEHLRRAPPRMRRDRGTGAWRCVSARSRSN